MDFIDCKTGYSFFKTIDSIWGDLTPKHTLNRICTMMRCMGVETLITDNLGKDCPEWHRFEEEKEALYLRLGGKLKKIKAIKLSFLRKSIKSKFELAKLAKQAKQGKQDPFLGYAIVVNITGKNGVWSYIFESVVRELGTWNESELWHRLPYHYLHVKKQFNCEVGKSPYKIMGVYFRQQNSITNVCAHACTTMMINNASLPNGIVTAEDINRHLNYDHVKRKFRANKDFIGKEENLPAGPGIEELKSVFKHYGYEPYPLEFNSEEEQRKFRSFLYGFVESQFPALLTFDSQEGLPDQVGHVVPVVGHTLNIHSWLPVTGSYKVGNWSDMHHSPLGWVNDLIIHDDNHGMQFSLPAHAFKPAADPEKDKNLTPRVALGIFPVSYDLKMLGNDAESIAASAIRTIAHETQGKFFEGNYYTKRFWSSKTQALRRTTIFRPVLVKWNEYLEKFWRDRKMPMDTLQFVERIKKMNIPNVWLVEVTEPDLFVGNHAKVMDVLLNPKVKPAIQNFSKKDESFELTKETVLLIRLPQKTIIPKPESKSGEWESISGWEVEGHFPLFCHGNE